MRTVHYDKDLSVIHVMFGTSLGKEQAHEFRNALSVAIATRQYQGMDSGVQLVGWNDDCTRVSELHVRVYPYMSQTMIRKLITMVKAISSYCLVED